MYALECHRQHIFFSTEKFCFIDGTFVSIHLAKSINWLHSDELKMIHFAFDYMAANRTIATSSDKKKKTRTNKSFICSILFALIMFRFARELSGSRAKRMQQMIRTVIAISFVDDVKLFIFIIYVNTQNTNKNHANE